MRKNRFMTMKTLFGKMQEIVDRELDSFKSDFINDIDYLKTVECECKETALAWFVRDMGTHMVNLTHDKYAEIKLDGINECWGDVVKRFNIAYRPEHGWIISSQ